MFREGDATRILSEPPGLELASIVFPSNDLDLAGGHPLLDTTQLSHSKYVNNSDSIPMILNEYIMKMSTFERSERDVSVIEAVNMSTLHVLCPRRNDTSFPETKESPARFR